MRTHIRIERDGYKTIESELRTAVLPSRIVGGIFTLGLVPIFKRPHTYVSGHDYVLEPLPSAVTAVTGEVPRSDGSVATRLKEARELHQKGLLSDAEYDAVRRDVLSDL